MWYEIALRHSYDSIKTSYVVIFTFPNKQWCLTNKDFSNVHAANNYTVRVYRKIQFKTKKKY